MELSAQQKTIVNTTFNRILSMEISKLFYSRLLQVNPELQELFVNTDMHQQRKMFFDMIQVIIYAIDNPSSVQNTIKGLIIRHMDYGVKGEDYAKVANAFLWVLADRLGDNYTEDVDDAWQATFDYILQVAREVDIKNVLS